MRYIIMTMLMTMLTLKACNNNDVYQGEEGTMRYEMNGTYHRNSLDSLIETDTLPMIEYWVQSSFRDYETKERIVRMIYMKDDNVYIVESKGNDSVYINKRILEIEGE